MARQKTKQQQQTALRKKCVTKAKLIAKERDSWTCVKCGRTKAEGWQIHGAHIIAETSHATCAEPDNIIALCARCHIRWHEHPIETARWFEGKYPGLFDTLQAKATAYTRNPFPKIDWAEVLDSLNNSY